MRDDSSRYAVIQGGIVSAPPTCSFRIFFFFSSRRRHTRFDCDWSSDVCSSDLTYGLLERQFRNYFEKAVRMKGPSGENLIVMLERRLDNAVWRAGLASSRSQARQLVLHGHVRVNGKKVNIPSYLVNVGEEISIKENMHQNAVVLEARNVAQSQNAVPWLEQQREQFKAKVVALPKREDVQTPPINEQLIVELYSK